MVRIISFELKKILRSKLTVGVVLVGFLLIIYSFLPKMIKYSFYDDDGNLLKRHQAVSYEKGLAKEMFNKVQTNEEIQSNINKLKEEYIVEKNKTGYEFDKALPKDIYYGFYKPREKYFNWIAQNYAAGPSEYWNPHDLMLRFNELNNFYEQRQQKVQNQLGSIRYSKIEKKFWEKRADVTKGPYKYGYFSGWYYIDESLDMFALVILAIGIAISSVYSSEHETEADAVLLSSKYGRTKLVTGKIIASLIFAVFTVLLGVLLCIIPILLFFGLEGWNLPIQVLNTDILYEWDLLKTIEVRVLMIILSSLVVTAIGLTLSSLIKKTTPAVVIVIMLYIGGLFVPTDKGSKLYQMIVRFLPVFLGGRQYYGFVGYPAFGKMYTFFGIATRIYVLLIFILLPISGMIFKKHQVK